MGWQKLDHLCKLNILSRLSTKELSVIACLSREERDFVNDPLIWQRRLAEEFGVSVRKGASQPAWAFKALYQGLAARKIGVRNQECKPNTTYPVRFQALYTDGGVDEDLFKQYWADLALECNHWGAFCSKVSPNVNVLALIQTPSEQEQAARHHRAFLADRCRFAAGRMLARVPLPPRDAPPTPRQLRYYAKAGAVLLRWSTPALERLFCLLYASRKSGEPIGRSLDLGLTSASSTLSSGAQGHSSPDAAEAALRAKFTEIVHSRLGREAGDALIQAESSPAQVLQALTASYQAAAAAAAAQHAELGSGGSGGGQAGAGGGVDPRDIAQDPSSLKLLHRKQARKLCKPADLASYTAVMDMIAVSRAGNNVFTCPVRTGAVLLGTVTGATPAAPLPGPPPDRYIPQAELTARERAAAVNPQDAAAWDHVAGIVGQRSCTALENVNTAEAVFAAVAAGSLPPVVQYRLMPHFEFVEFARQHSKSDSEAAIPLSPVIWYRFFTNQELAHLRAVDKERAAQLSSRERGPLRWTSLPRGGIVSFLTHVQRQQQQRQRQQPQQQPQQQEQAQAGEGSTKKASVRGKTKGASSSTKVASSSRAQGQGSGSSSHAPGTSPPHTSLRPASRARKGTKTAGAAGRGSGAAVSAPTSVPQELVVMSAAGQLEVVNVEGLMAADARVGLEQAAWGYSLVCAQEKLAAKERKQQSQQQQDSQEGGEGGQQQQQQQGESMETDSCDEGDVHTGSLMEEDLQNLQDQLDEESMMMGVEPPEDVGEMLTIMGYDNDGQGEEGGAEGMEHGEDGTSSGSSSAGQEEEDTSDTEGHGGGHAPQDELGSSDEDDAGSDLPEGLLDEEDLASRFTDIMDTTPPPLSERLLLTHLAQHVGLHLLMNSHNELEREGQLIVEQELGMRVPTQGLEGRSNPTQPQQANEQPGSASHKVSEVMRLLPGDETAADSTALHDGVVENEHTSHAGLLQARLKQPRAGNMLCLKLISPENKMEEMQDMHDAPNVDLQFAAFRGVAVQLQHLQSE